MAYLVKRSNGSWEIRESRMTEKGPRSVTLATFREDTPEMRAKVLRRSTSSFLESELEQRLDEAGVPPAMTNADRAARDLLLELERGSRPSEALRSSLLDALTDRHPEDRRDREGERSEVDSADDAVQGRILEDVLDLAVELPYEPDAEIAQRPLRELVEGQEVG